MNNKPIIVTNRAAIITAVFVGNSKSKKILTSPYNPIMKNGIPTRKEPKAKCSPTILPP